MSSSSDDFFSKFGDSPQEKKGSNARPRPPGPPPPPPPPPKGSWGSKGSSKAPMVPSRTNTRTNNLSTTSKHLNNSSSQTGYYSQQSQQQQQQQQQPSTNANSSSSYYGTPAAAAPASSWPTTNENQTSISNDWQHVSKPPDQQQQQQIVNPYLLQKKSKHAPNSAGLEGAMDGGTQSNQNQFAGNGFAPGTIDSSAFSGTMDNKAQTTQFIPQQPQQGAPNSSPKSLSAAKPYDPSEFADEPPLLEELGINVEHIIAKTRAVVLPFQRFGGNMDATVIQDADLAGPIALALLLGGELLLSGKIHFAYIYGFGVFGCLAMTLVLNLMSPQGAISIWTVTSILGYSLLPVNLLALLKIFLVNLGRLETLGRCLAILTVLWCTVASTRLMEQGCDMRDQRYLIAYPICLLYSAFVLITIF